MIGRVRDSAIRKLPAKDAQGKPNHSPLLGNLSAILCKSTRVHLPCAERDREMAMFAVQSSGGRPLEIRFSPLNAPSDLASLARVARFGNHVVDVSVRPTSVYCISRQGFSSRFHGLFRFPFAFPPGRARARFSRRVGNVSLLRPTPPPPSPSPPPRSSHRSSARDEIFSQNF